MRAAWRRGALALVAAVALLAVPGTSRAASTSVAGSVGGVELCPQFVCGAAIFIGAFEGTVDGLDETGGWWVAVRHDELPRPGQSAQIVGGQWGMTLDGRSVRGGVVTSGTITNIGNKAFVVVPRLAIHEGGAGALALSILLDHAPFPPRVHGSVAPIAE